MERRCDDGGRGWSKVQRWSQSKPSRQSLEAGQGKEVNSLPAGLPTP